MKKLITLTVASLLMGTMAYAGDFEKRSEMMQSRIASKVEKYKDNAAAQEFLSKKMACVKAAKTSDELKDCKKKYHPKDLKKIVK